jgi:predicted Na+-dependent transporter
LGDLQDVSNTITDPWFLIGDFNLTCDLSDKNTTSFNANLAAWFNHAIDSLQLIEMLLLGSLFTWSTKRIEPTLVTGSCFPQTLPFATSSLVLP